MPEDLNIERDRHPDPDALDVDWLEQPNLFYKYSDALNDAIEERNTQKLEVEWQKEKLETTKAQIELDIRNKPEDYGLEKVTEGSIKAALLTDETYLTALATYYDARKELNDLQNQVNRLTTQTNTMMEKKVALQELSKLLAQQYFCTPTVPRELTKEHQKRQDYKETQKKARDKVKRKKKENKE